MLALGFGIWGKWAPKARRTAGGWLGEPPGDLGFRFEIAISSCPPRGKAGGIPGSDLGSRIEIASSYCPPRGMAGGAPRIFRFSY